MLAIPSRLFLTSTICSWARPLSQRLAAMRQAQMRAVREHRLQASLAALSPQLLEDIGCAAIRKQEFRHHIGHDPAVRIEMKTSNVK